MENTIKLICTCLGVVTGFIGMILALIQWRESCAIKRCEYNSSILNDFRINKDLLDITYKFEYEPFWYNSDFHKSEIEKKFDNYFLFINYICFLYNTRRIKKKEFRAFEYIVNRVCNNKDMQAYLWNLYHYSKVNNSECTYNEIIQYCKKKKIIDKYFFSNSIDKYPKKYLNF